jgi:excinuclease ABC subunit B
MYADNMTKSMSNAIDETNRRRAKQVAYNTKHGIDPTPLRKRIADITDLIAKEADDTDVLSAKSKKIGLTSGFHSKSAHSLPRQELVALIESLTDQMRLAASQLNFELAARLRDEIRELKRELKGMQEAGTG